MVSLYPKKRFLRSFMLSAGDLHTKALLSIDPQNTSQLQPCILGVAFFVLLDNSIYFSIIFAFLKGLPRAIIVHVLHRKNLPRTVYIICLVLFHSSPCWVWIIKEPPPNFSLVISILDFSLFFKNVCPLLLFKLG